MSDLRKLEVLRAIVEDYVHSREPVGSKALVDRHHLGVSSTTIRNDMAALEEDGLITAPHTSAGRIPTDKGYRIFVDLITEVKPLSSAEKRAIQTVLSGSTDLDDVLERTVRTLAQLTNQVAVVQYPTSSSATVRHVEFVSLSPHQVLIVLILDNGKVEQSVFDVGQQLSSEELASLRNRFLPLLSGFRPSRFRWSWKLRSPWSRSPCAKWPRFSRTAWWHCPKPPARSASWLPGRRTWRARTSTSR